MVITSRELKYCRLDFFEHYVILTMNEGSRVSKSVDMEILGLLEGHYKHQDFIFISNRIHKYEIDLDIYKGGNYMDLMRGALQFADAIVYGAEELSADYVKMAEETGKPILTYQGEDDYVNAYNTFYDSLLED